MIRTQVYLTKSERKSVKLLAERFKKSQSAIIRNALDNFLESVAANEMLALSSQSSVTEGKSEQGSNQED